MTAKAAARTARDNKIVASNGGLKPTTEHPPAFGIFKVPGQKYDVEVLEIQVGTDYDGDDCPQVRGRLLVDTVIDKGTVKWVLEAGSEITITGGPVILHRKMQEGIDAGEIAVGHRWVIEYIGDTSGGAKKFESNWDYLDLSEDRVIDDEPAPF